MDLEEAFDRVAKENSLCIELRQQLGVEDIVKVV